MEAKAMAGQAIAKAQQLEKDLMEARRQISVLAEDGDNLEDKVFISFMCLSMSCLQLPPALY